jgi:adenosine/AMP kinase
MRHSFKQFENSVRMLCDKRQFELHKEELKEIYISSYDSFILLLKYGVNIVEAKKACEEIFKLSVATHNTENEIVGILLKILPFIPTKQFRL